MNSFESFFENQKICFLQHLNSKTQLFVNSLCSSILIFPSAAVILSDFSDMALYKSVSVYAADCCSQFQTFHLKGKHYFLQGTGPLRTYLRGMNSEYSAGKKIHYFDTMIIFRANVPNGRTYIQDVAFCSIVTDTQYPVSWRAHAVIVYLCHTVNINRLQVFTRAPRSGFHFRRCFVVCETIEASQIGNADNLSRHPSASAFGYFDDSRNRKALYNRVYSREKYIYI